MNTEYQLIEYQLLLVVSGLCSKICQLCYAALLQYFTYYAQQFPYYAKNYACFMVNLSTLCFDDCTWFFIMLSFSDSSSRQAEQNSFPADTVTITSESCSLCSTNSLWIGRASWLLLSSAGICGGSLVLDHLTLAHQVRSCGSSEFAKWRCSILWRSVRP